MRPGAPAKERRHSAIRLTDHVSLQFLKPAPNTIFKERVEKVRHKRAQCFWARENLGACGRRVGAASLKGALLSIIWLKRNLDFSEHCSQGAGFLDHPFDEVQEMTSKDLKVRVFLPIFFDKSTWE